MPAAICPSLADSSSFARGRIPCDSHLGPYGHERLYQTGHPLVNDSAVRKQIAELTPVEQLNLAGVGERLFIGLGLGKPAEPKPLEQKDLVPLRQELKTGKQEMRLNRKVAIGRLHEVALPHPTDLICHSLLIGSPADVFNHRIGKNQ